MKRVKIGIFLCCLFINFVCFYNYQTDFLTLATSTLLSKQFTLQEERNHLLTVAPPDSSTVTALTFTSAQIKWGISKDRDMGPSSFLWFPDTMSVWTIGVLPGIFSVKNFTLIETSSFGFNVDIFQVNFLLIWSYSAECCFSVSTSKVTLWRHKTMKEVGWVTFLLL